MKMLLIELFALANYGEVQEKGRTLVAGQMITTLAELMERTGLSKKEVRSRLDKLVAEGKLTKIGTNHYLVLTIVGYHKLFKGTQNPMVTASVSASPSTSTVNSGTGEARNEAFASNSVPTSFVKDEGQEDTQSGTPELVYTNKNKENVVESTDSTTTNVLSFEERRKKLIDDVNAIVEEKGWKKSYGFMPEFNDAIRKFIRYNGKEVYGKMFCETKKDFVLGDMLISWLYKENSLKGKIKI